VWSGGAKSEVEPRQRYLLGVNREDWRGGLPRWTRGIQKKTRPSRRERQGPRDGTYCLAGDPQKQSSAVASLKGRDSASNDAKGRGDEVIFALPKEKRAPKGTPRNHCHPPRLRGGKGLGRDTGGKRDLSRRRNYLNETTETAT